MKENKKNLNLKKLTPEQFYTTQEKGTDAPFTGKYVHHHETGTYSCVVCGNVLFDSKTKFDSESGWPSFFDLKEKGAVTIERDTSLDIERNEVLCTKCGAHLGHLFNDGPEKETGLRYCMNSSGLTFNEETPKH